ncbi:MAG: hypothetical protein ACYSTL_08075 [Planctomycetota bacterium]|jgi:hypothetical protein
MLAKSWQGLSKSIPRANKPVPKGVHALPTYPFPVDRRTYDSSIQVLLDAVRKARIGETEKTEALKRLAANS